MLRKAARKPQVATNEAARLLPLRAPYRRNLRHISPLVCPSRRSPLRWNGTPVQISLCHHLRLC